MEAVLFLVGALGIIVAVPVGIYLTRIGLRGERNLVISALGLVIIGFAGWVGWVIMNMPDQM